MEMLNSFSLLLSGNLWATLLNIFAKWIVNYGWTIIVFTILLKLVLSPLDLMQRFSTTKQQRVMAYMQPEINAINEKYAGDKERINAETNKLYKKYNTGLGGSCIIMLVTMVVSMVVFFTLYGSIRSYGNEKMYESYKELDTAYEQTYNRAAEDYELLPEDEKEAISLTDYAKNKAKEAVIEENKTLSEKTKWLWVKNVFKADKSYESQFVKLEDYLKHYNIAADSAEGRAITERYEAITSSIVGEGKDANGYFGLIIACVLVSFLAQFISAKTMQQKGQKMNMMNKIMMLAMPVAMFIFAWTSNALFTLYIITNSIMTTLLSFIISLIMKGVGKKDVQKLMKKKSTEVVEYSRNYKK